MQIIRALPLLPLCRRLMPDRLPSLTPALLKATLLEGVVLVGHLVLYPAGLIERPAGPAPACPLTPKPAPSAGTRTAPTNGRTGTAEAAETAEPETSAAPAAHELDTAERTSAERTAAERTAAERTACERTTTAGSAGTGPRAEATHGGEVHALPTPDKPPVVLLHGFIDNRSVFVLLHRRLVRDGHRHVEALNYSPLTTDIRTAADLLQRHVEEICARTGHDQVDIVGHSLGGLIARYYVQRLGGDSHVRTLVTLGTPHAGTRTVPLMNAHPVVRQMRPGSPVLEELRLPAPGCRTRFFAFWSDLDQVMDPPESARISHPDLDAQNVRVSGVGHLALPVHPAVASRVREVLAPEAATGEPRRRNGLTVA